MGGRGVAVAVVLLLAVLGFTFKTLHDKSRDALVEAERKRRERDFEATALGLSERVDEAQAILRRLVESPALNDVLEPGATQADFETLDGLLADLRRPAAGERQAVLALQLIDVGGRPLAGIDARRGALAPGPLTAWSLSAGVQAAIDAPGTGTVELNARGPGPPTVSAATVVGRRRSAVAVVVLSVGPELEACSAFAGRGSWGLLDGDGLVLAPQGVDSPQPPTSDPLRGQSVIEVEGEAIVCATRLASVPRPAWLLLARVPTESTQAVAGDLRATLLVAALAVVLVLAIGVGSTRASYLQQSLSESESQERFLQAMFDAITDVLLVVDRDMNVVRANRVAMERFGVDIVGRPYSEIVTRRGTDPAADLAGLREVLDGGRPRLVELTAQGDSTWQIAQYGIRSQGPVQEGVVEVSRDVTQTRRLQSQLVQSEKLSTLGELAAGIAHEINNPIGVISMFAQLLQEEVKEAQGDESPLLDKVKIIEDQAVAAGGIVSNLLRFSRKSEGVKERIDVRTGVERAMNVVKHQKQVLKGIELVKELDQEPVPEVMGDEAQLGQVILNLIVNASHALDGKGTITLAVHQRGPDDPPPPGRVFGEPNDVKHRVDLIVSDTGKGIPPETLERIFEPFYTTKAAGKGTGLGLSVGFGIIRDHGGCIWVNSEPDVGTTFTLDLPAAPPA